MKRKTPTARECARQLKAKGKTLDDAVKHYLRLLERKKSTGRKKGSGALSGIDPPRESWTEIRNRIVYDSAEWPLVALRILIADSDTKRWPDNTLTAHTANILRKATQPPKIKLKDIDRLWKKLRAKRGGKPPLREEWLSELGKLQDSNGYKPQSARLAEIASLWQMLRGRFERAALDGNADWFQRQAKALRSVQSQEKIQFNAKVVYLLEMAMWSTHAKQSRVADQQESELNSELSKLIGQRKAEQAGMTKEQIVARKRKPYAVSKGAEQDRKQREHAAKIKAILANIPQDDLTLTSAGKFTGAMARDIYNALEKHEKSGVLYVEGCKFESKERVMDAIHDLADQIQFALTKQARKRRRKR
jgi:hypothetical protein